MGNTFFLLSGQCTDTVSRILYYTSSGFNVLITNLINHVNGNIFPKACTYNGTIIASYVPAHTKGIVFVLLVINCLKCYNDEIPIVNKYHSVFIHLLFMRTFEFVF